MVRDPRTEVAMDIGKYATVCRSVEVHASATAQ